MFCDWNRSDVALSPILNACGKAVIHLVRFCNNSNKSVRVLPVHTQHQHPESASNKSVRVLPVQIQHPSFG